MQLNGIPYGLAIKNQVGEIHILGIHELNAETTERLNAAPLNSLAIAGANVFGAGIQAYYTKVGTTNIPVDDWIRLVSTETIAYDLENSTGINLEDLNNAVSTLQTSVTSLEDGSDSQGADISNIISQLGELTAKAVSGGVFYQTVTASASASAAPATPFDMLAMKTNAVSAVKFLISAECEYGEGNIRRETSEILIACNSNALQAATSSDLVQYAMFSIGGGTDLGLEFTTSLSGSGDNQLITLNVQRGVEDQVKVSATVIDWTQHSTGKVALFSLIED